MQTNKVLLKQMTIEFLGNSQSYENFKRMVEAGPHLYTHDFTFYNDHITQRHLRNIKQLNKIRALIQHQTMTPSMLTHNISNAFYPSYILHHHYSVFITLLQAYFPKQLPTLNKSSSVNFLGAFLQQTKSTNLKPQKERLPLLNNKGQLEMDKDWYFYSPHSSPYLTHALLVAQQNDKKVLVLVEVKDKADNVCQGVSVFDFGGTISNDYLPVGYHFNKVQPLAVAELTSGPSKMIGSLSLKQKLDQFNFSLKDLQRSLWITAHYTAMRTQFKTIADSKQERPIISYQAISTRLLQNFALFTAFSDLNARLLQNQGALVFSYSDLLQGSHHIILESLISLRQCCGGFGFMQFSGHPACIERVCSRAGRDSSSSLSFNKQFLKATQFYTSSQQLLKFYSDQVSQPKITYFQTFGLFLSICQNMRKESQKQNPKQYKREYLRQCAIMSMHSRQEFLRYEASNVHCQLLQYLVCSYLIKNARFINWQLVKVTKQVLITELHQLSANLLLNLTNYITTLTQALELGFLRNVVIGRPKQQSFYNQLVKVSKQNLRNHAQFKKYIREPVVEMLTKNNASL